MYVVPPFFYTQGMIYGYILVSTDKQTIENQRFEILKYADEKKLSINEWIEETVSSTKALTQRKLGTLIQSMKKKIFALPPNFPALAAPSWK